MRRTGKGLVTLLMAGSGVLLTACDEGAGTTSTATSPATAFQEPLELDVEAPDVFRHVGLGIWDGRTSLGGVWVAHPLAGQPERVLITNTITKQQIKGALFRKDSSLAGPSIQLSSDAARSIGVKPGEPTELEIVALRREVVQPDPPASVETAETTLEEPTPGPETGVETVALPSEDTGETDTEAASDLVAAEPGNGTTDVAEPEEVATETGDPDSEDGAETSNILASLVPATTEDETPTEPVAETSETPSADKETTAETSADVTSEPVETPLETPVAEESTPATPSDGEPESEGLGSIFARIFGDQDEAETPEPDTTAPIETAALPAPAPSDEPVTPVIVDTPAPEADAPTPTATQLPPAEEPEVTAPVVSPTPEPATPIQVEATAEPTPIEPETALDAPEAPVVNPPVAETPRPTEPAPVAAAPAETPAPPSAEDRPERAFVQVGLFGVLDNAQRLKRQLELEGYTVRVRTTKIKDKDYTRVMVGPGNSKADVQRLVDAMRTRGFRDATPVRG